MKIKNRIMSWILSPGAYALWHSMGNPEEWDWHEGNERFAHKTARLTVKMGLWWTGGPPVAALIFVPIFWFIVVPLWAIWPVIRFKCEEPYEDAIGWFDRHVIAGRAMRLRGKLLRTRKTSRKRNANMELFSRLTVNE